MRRAPLLCLLLTLAAAAVGSAQTTVDETFEDGRYHGLRTRMHVPPQILTEGGGTFLRVTGSAKDRQSLPARAPDRNRSTIQFTAGFRSMPRLTDANRRQTYSVDLRVTPRHGKFGLGCCSTSIFELFQMADGESESYGSRNGIGPAARLMWKNNNHVIFENRWDNEQTVDNYDLGYVAPGTWHHYRIDALWSYDRAVARFDVYLDGELKHRVRGEPSNLGPRSSRLPMVKVGAYGDWAVGTVDVDNLRVGPTGVGDPAPEEPSRPDRLAVNAGGPKLTSVAGLTYEADAWSTAGKTERTTDDLGRPDTSSVYQSWRYGKRFGYEVPLANGTYQLTLHFAEHYWTAPGRRVFRVDVEGQPAVPTLDVFATAGPVTPYDVTVPVTVKDKALSLTFRSSAGNAMVSGFTVVPSP